MALYGMELPPGYSASIDPDGATLLRNSEVLYRYGPGWSPECVAHDAWRHCRDTSNEVQRLNELFKGVS